MTDGSLAGKAIDSIRPAGDFKPTQTAELILARLSDAGSSAPAASHEHLDPKSRLDRGLPSDRLVESPRQAREVTRPGLLKRIIAYLMPEGAAKPETAPQVRLDNADATGGGQDKLTVAMEKLESSQRFAAGMALSSSLTQSVMSSSRRLTQGQ